MHELIIFLAAFSSVFLGCFQAINVVYGRHIWAVITSAAQAGAALTLYKTIPDVDTALGVAAFIIAGVLGGQASMVVTRRTRRRPQAHAETINT